MLVGRFEDGTPLTTQFADGNHHPVPNDFNYDSDPNGAPSVRSSAISAR